MAVRIAKKKNVFDTLNSVFISHGRNGLFENIIKLIKCYEVKFCIKLKLYKLVEANIVIFVRVVSLRLGFVQFLNLQRHLNFH